MHIRVTILFITCFQYSSGYILYHCIYGCMFFTLQFNFYQYILISLRNFIIMLCVLLLA
jgi:hypothetical protein